MHHCLNDESEDDLAFFYFLAGLSKIRIYTMLQNIRKYKHSRCFQKTKNLRAYSSSNFKNNVHVDFCL